ncbi:hypothetical protein KSK37_13285 [Kaistella sp. DKR-2]|uniref:hypothetical protein n=1 Tax=Kaistella soli TaxID=2849654 RepID=UPI001C26873F|nr:hypothetical protein [Kaistella soli]MBU8884062.1 hypothetical protein [Kaistella soli]
MPILIGCNSKNIIQKTSYLEGSENNLKHYDEYKTRTRTLISEIDGVVTVKNFRMKNGEKLKFLNTLKALNINDNYCWVSLESLPEYSWKYEIILNEKEPLPKCIQKPKYEVFEAYRVLTDTIKE